MSNIFSLVFFALLVSTSCLYSTVANCERDIRSVYGGLQLKLVQVVFRHGDRTPLSRLPQDTTSWVCHQYPLLHPYNSSSSNSPIHPPTRFFRKVFIPNAQMLAGSCYAGQLTSVGMHQHHEVGKMFRKLYVDKLGFLSSSLNQQEILIRSTDIPRTFESAQSQLRGLYPELNNTEELISLVNIHTVETSREYLYPNPAFCPKIQTLMDEAHKTPEWKAHDLQLVDLKNTLIKVLNFTTPNLPYKWSELRDMLNCKKSHNISLPDGVTDEMFDQIAQAASWELQFMLNYLDTTKLGIGVFMKELVDNMNKEIVAKWIMYSGHDTTVAPVLNALGIYDGHWPPYAAHIVFELFASQENQEQYVRVLYNGDEMVLPGCIQPLCPLGRFSKILSPLFPSHQYAQECNVPPVLKNTHAEPNSLQ